MPLKSKTNVKRLKAVFSEADPELSALLLRMSVAFEDLRIEFWGSRPGGRLDRLDDLSSTYRKFYFLRRSTVTVVEFMGSFQLLDRSPEFQRSVQGFSPELRAEWRAAKSFFELRKEFLKRVRNDYGGHFQLGTARTVLKNLHTDLVSQIEVRFDPVERTATPLLHYAFDIVALAFDSHRVETRDVADHARELFETLTEAWTHCTNVMHAITKHHILPRFR